MSFKFRYQNDFQIDHARKCLTYVGPIGLHCSSYSEKDQVRAKMKVSCGSQNLKRGMNHIEKVAFATL